MSKRAREDEDDEAPAVVEAPAPAASAASSDPKQDKQERQAREARMSLAALPDQEMYEKSYMHRDVVTHLVVAATDFIITASRDGQLKFWKKQQTGIDFVKHFRAHLAPIAGLSVSFDG
jgi:peptidylprolyl isomerase domain and WD repeat-containing protein 1